MARAPYETTSRTAKRKKSSHDIAQERARKMFEERRRQLDRIRKANPGYNSPEQMDNAWDRTWGKVGTGIKAAGKAYVNAARNRGRSKPTADRSVPVNKSAAARARAAVAAAAKAQQKPLPSTQARPKVGLGKQTGRPQKGNTQRLPVNTPKVVPAKAPVNKPAPAAPKPAAKPAPKTSTAPTAVDQAILDLADAQRSVGLDLDPQLAEIKRRIAEIQANTAADTGRLNEANTKTQGGLDTIFKRLDTYLEGNQKLGSDALTTAKTGVGQTFDTLIGQIGKTGQAAAGNVQQELARLGITGVDPSVISSDANFLQGLAGVAKANTNNAMTNQGAAYNAIADLEQGNAAALGTSRKSAANQTTLDAIARLAQEARNQQNEYQGQQTTLEGQRGAKIQEMLRLIQQARFEQEMELGQQQFQNQLAQNKFGLDQSIAEQNMRNQAAERDFRNRELQARVQEAKAEAMAKQQGISIEQARLQLDRDRITTQQKIDREKLLQSATQKKTTYRGSEGALRLVAERAGPQTPKLQAIVRRIMTGGVKKDGKPRFDLSNRRDVARITTYYRTQLRDYGIDTAANRAIMQDALSALQNQYGG